MTRLGLLLAVVVMMVGCAATTSTDALRAENERLRRALAQKRADEHKKADEASTAAGREAAHREAWKSYRIGDTSVAWGAEAKLGWVSARARAVKPCDERTVGVELEVQNHGQETLSFSPNSDAHLFDANGSEKKTTYSFSGDCGDRSDGHVAAGATARIWLVFEASPKDARVLELALVEPSGMAQSTLSFALAADAKLPTKTAQPLAPRGEAPAERIGEPAETPFYRVTVTAMKPCNMRRTPSGKAIVGLELFIENFTNVPLTAGEYGTLKDERGYEYTDGEVSWDDGCTPRLGNATVAPGEKVRGWMFPFNLPLDAGKLELRYQLRGLAYLDSPVRIAVGAPPDTSKPAQPTLTWHPPAKASTAGTGYQLTVTDMRVCWEQDGRRYVGVEVLIHNHSSQTLEARPDAAIADAEGYRYDGQNVDLGTDSPCNPSLGYADVKPGDKVRGWLHFFEVPASAKGLELRYSLYFRDAKNSRTEDAALALGELR